MWDWLVADFGIRNMLDVGCGVGYAQKYFHSLGIGTCGIDCEDVLKHHVERCAAMAHDLTTGPVVIGDAPAFDLVWCCEVAEHIEEKFVDNIVNTIVLNARKVIAMCAAPPGAGGYHHVNCQPPEYWIAKLTCNGFEFCEYATKRAKELCDATNGRSERNYFRRSGFIMRKVS